LAVFGQKSCLKEMPPSCGTKINKTAASQMECKVISERFLRGNYFGDKGDSENSLGFLLDKNLV